MKFCLFVFEFTILWTLCRGEGAANRTVLATGCTKLYCYHVLGDMNFAPYYRKLGHLWPRLTQLQKICPERVSPNSWLLEIYNLEEQVFVEKFVSDYIPAKTSLLKEDPVLVPLNLNVTFKVDGWSWLNGNEAKGLRPSYLQHYAFIDIKLRGPAIVETASSDLPSHFGLCHIPRMYCKHLRSSFVMDDYCLYKVKEKLTWHQSRMQCHKRKGELTSIIPGYYLESTTNILIKTSPFVRIHGDLWVGLSDVEETWMKKNHSAIFTNWGGESVEPLKNESDFAFLEMDSLKWSVYLPNTFQLKLVCMTNNNNSNNNSNTNNDKDTKTRFIDTCRVTTTWLIVATAATSIIAISIGMFYLKDRMRFSFKSMERFRPREDQAALQPFEDLQQDFIQSLSYPNGILTHDH